MKIQGCIYLFIFELKNYLYSCSESVGHSTELVPRMPFDELSHSHSTLADGEELRGLAGCRPVGGLYIQHERNVAQGELATATTAAAIA